MNNLDEYIRIARAKDFAEQWNKLRKIINQPFNKSELSNLAREHKASYTTTIPSHLEKEQYIIPVGSGLTSKGKRVIKYKFAKPIHYSFFMDVQKFTPSGYLHKKKIAQKTLESKPSSQRTGNTHSLKLLPDAELVKELRSRGYEVTAIKTTTIEL